MMNRKLQAAFAAILLLSACATRPCRGGDRFFPDGIKFFDTERGCPGGDCSPRPPAPMQGEKGSETLAPQEAEREEPQYSLLGFVTLDSPYTQKAVAALAEFRDKHPEVHVRGVVILPLQGSKRLLAGHMDLWKTKIPFTVDFSFSEATNYRIDRVPTFVFEAPGRSYKIAGQPELDEIYATALPLDKNP